MSEVNCKKCNAKLTLDEYLYFNNHEDLVSIADGYLCGQHWCRCMPHSTPWKWLNGCAVYDENICNSSWL